MRHSRLPRLSLALLLSAILVMVTLGVGCGGGAVEEKPTIRLIDGNWSSLLVENEILEQILNEQLDYPTEKILMAPSLGWPALAKGEADIALEIWLPNRQFEIDPLLEDGTIELVGQFFPGGMGWVVPRYVIEGDPERGIEAMAPDLKDITDLEQYWQLFESPEKPGFGELVGGSPGWQDDPMDRSIIAGYELPLWRSNQSEPIMMARMIAADKKGDPLLMYIWWPHWIFAVVDLVKLEAPDPWYEGAFSGEVVPVRAGYPPIDIQKVVRVGLEDDAPDVYRLVTNWVLTEAEINALMERVDVAEEDVAAVAADWISQNQDKIDQWLEE